MLSSPDRKHGFIVCLCVISSLMLWFYFDSTIRSILWFNSNTYFVNDPLTMAQVSLLTFKSMDERGFREIMSHSSLQRIVVHGGKIYSNIKASKHSVKELCRGGCSISDRSQVLLHYLATLNNESPLPDFEAAFLVNDCLPRELEHAPIFTHSAPSSAKHLLLYPNPFILADILSNQLLYWKHKNFSHFNDRMRKGIVVGSLRPVCNPTGFKCRARCEGSLRKMCNDPRVCFLFASQKNRSLVDIHLPVIPSYLSTGNCRMGLTEVQESLHQLNVKTDVLEEKKKADYQLIISIDGRCTLQWRIYRDFLAGSAIGFSNRFREYWNWDMEPYRDFIPYSISDDAISKLLGSLGDQSTLENMAFHAQKTTRDRLDPETTKSYFRILLNMYSIDMQSFFCFHNATDSCGLKQLHVYESSKSS